HRQQVDRLESVLLSVCLSLDQQHLLRQPIRSVRLFRVTIPKVLLTERNRRELRVGADRANRYKLAHPVLASRLHELHTHHQIIVEELARLLTIDPYPANRSRHMNNDILTPNCALANLPASHIVSRTARNGYLISSDSTRCQHLDDVRSEKTC